MFFHWVMAVLILVLFLLGWYMVDLPKGSSERTFFFTLHKSVGLTVAFLLVLRLGWRWQAAAMAPASGLAPWQVRLAANAHRLLYVVMVLQPLSGYISSSFSGYPTRVWGIVLPQWADKNPELNQLFTDVHEVISMVLCALILLHLCGALWHFIGKHPSVLPRMWPARQPPAPKA
jgi:cytochrome b561